MRNGRSEWYSQRDYMDLTLEIKGNRKRSEVTRFDKIMGCNIISGVMILNSILASSH